MKIHADYQNTQLLFNPGKNMNNVKFQKNYQKFEELFFNHTYNWLSAI